MSDRAGEPRGHAAAALPCVLKSGAHFDGLIALRGAGRLDGSVRGEVIGSDLLWIGEAARVDARMTAPEIVIEGDFRGEAAASGRIELLSSARVRATLETARLILAEGAFFEGQCRTRDDREPEAEA
jgi:cytoskeletal protein CcmA (bactofilin family)